jgi:hypothetical protein
MLRPKRIKKKKVINKPSVSGDNRIKPKDIADALDIITRKLASNNIIIENSFATLSEEIRRIRALPASRADWEVIVPNDKKIIFDFIFDESGQQLSPRMMCCIRSKQSNTNSPPFEDLVLTLELFDSSDKINYRWHIDRANKKDGVFQEGPLYHLQYGGHNSDARKDDSKLKVPRWLYPPMEVMLFCEMMVANFYPSKWDTLQEDPAWREAICIAQKLCYTAYSQKIVSQLSNSSNTMLQAMWASTWGA